MQTLEKRKAVALQDAEFVAVVDQGYVGLPLSMACLRAGSKTIGLNANPDRIKEIISRQHDFLNKKREKSSQMP